MSEKRRGLGRGLGALIPSNAAPVTRPVGDRPVDVFFPGKDGADDTADTAAASAAQASGAPVAAPAPLTVLPGGRRVPGDDPSAEGSAPSVPVARLAPAPATGPTVAPGGPVPSQPAAQPAAPVAPAVVPVAPRPAPVPSGTAPTGTSPSIAAPPAPGPVVARETAPSSAPSSPLTPPAGEPAGEPARPAEGRGTGERLEGAGTPVAVESSAISTPPAAAGAADDGLVPVPGASFAELPVASVRPNPKQPRQVFDEEELAELVHSIREVGVLQPIVVRSIADDAGDARYELIMGERRLRAAKDAGLERIPAIIRDTQDDAMLRDALLENLHRSQLNPLEEAAAYQQLLDDFGCTHEELAGRIGRSRPQISNTLRLLKLPPLVQRRLAAGVLSAGHARALLGLEDQAAMERLAQRIVAEGLSVRAVEEIVALGDGPVAKPVKKRPRPGSHTSELDELASRLGDRLDTRVAIALGRSKGKLSIEFASVDDLNRIIGLLGPEVRGVFAER